MRTKTLRKTFFSFLAPFLTVFLVLSTGFILYHDYTNALEWREQSQALIFKMFLSSVRQPLIQGSLVEAQERAIELAKSEQISCVEVEERDKPFVLCPKSSKSNLQFRRMTSDLRFGSEDTKVFGRVLVDFNNSDLISQVRAKIARLSLIVITVTLFAGLFLARAFRKVERELMNILNEASKNHDQSSFFEIREFQFLSDEFRKYIASTSELAQARAEVEISKQVAHDIRPPLSALMMLVKIGRRSTANDEIEILDAATKRIGEIADDLTRPRTLDLREHKDEYAVVQTCIREIIDEKKQIYSATSSSIKFNDRELALIIVQISPADLKRVLSNLLDNAYQALTQEGNIEVSLYLRENRTSVIIRDSGKGIPDSVKPLLFSRGATFEKVGGQGLGLYGTRNIITRYGGEIEIESVPQEGTTVTVSLPITTDAIFTRELKIGANSRLLIVDNDISVFHIWSQRRTQDALEIELVYVTRQSQISEDSSNENHFLVDFDLGPSEPTGLDVIAKFGISKNSTLVTNHFSDAQVRNRAAAMGVKILPKDSISYVPITVLARG